MVSIYQDVEDPINPLADDAALDLARVFSDAGVRGSICLTGEKCRTLLARGRQDVLDAFRPHCLGLHTDTHSYHPTTMELLADVDWEVGCDLAFRAEKRGYDAFVAAFGRPPAFWGGAGNTWSPEITDALKRLGIPAYVYALTELPDHALHRFNGVHAFSQDLTISEPEWADDRVAAAKMEAVLESARSRPYCGIFTGHPTKFRHARYWDTPFNSGLTPSNPELAEPLPVETYERSKKNLRIFLEQIAQEPKVVGVDEVLALDWTYRALSKEERAYFAVHTEKNLRGAANWPIHRPNLQIDGIVNKTLALLDTVEAANLKL